MTENHQLSDRELEILRLVATGASNKDIANQLVISVNTVKVHLRNIFSKLEVSSRTEATMWAVRAGLVTPEIDPADPEPQEALPEEIEEQSPGWFRRFWWLGLAGILVILLALFGVWFIGQQNPEPISEVPAEQSVEPERWQELSGLSMPRSHFAFASYENQLYTIGGQTETNADTVVALVERYDPQLNQWTSLSPKPVAVADASAAVVGGKIYVPGGRLASGDITDHMDIYLPSDDQWASATPLPVALSAYALAEFEGKLYLFGGWDGTQFVDTVYEYDPAQDSWSLRAPLPTARGFAGAAVIGNRIYVLGGYDGDQALTTNEIFLPGNLDTPWLDGVPLPESRYAVGVASFADVIYLIGGKNDAGGAQTSFQFSPQDGLWKPVESLQAQTWTHMGAQPLGSTLFIWGGELGGAQTEQLWSYQAIYTLVLPIIQTQP